MDCHNACRTSFWFRLSCYQYILIGWNGGAWTHDFALTGRCFTTKLHSKIGSVGWGRTNDNTGQSRAPYHLATTDYVVRSVGVEPTIWGFQSPRVTNNTSPWYKKNPCYFWRGFTVSDCGLLVWKQLFYRWTKPPHRVVDYCSAVVAMKRSWLNCNALAIDFQLARWLNPFVTGHT